MLGLPPDEDRNESVIGSQAAQVVQLLVQVGSGAVDREQAMAFLEGMGLPTELADRIAGKQKEKQEVAQATETLQEAVRALQLDPKQLVSQIERSLKYKPSQPRKPAGSSAGGEFASGGGSGGGGESGSKPESKPEVPKLEPESVTQYQQEQRAWERSLSNWEHDGLRSYTGKRYHNVRDCLNKKVGCDKRTIKEIEGLKSALARAPKYKGEVYRGIKFDSAKERDEFLASVKKNGGMTSKGFTSTSESMNIAEEFSTGKYAVMLKIGSKTGVRISGFSKFQREKEVVLSPSAKLKFKRFETHSSLQSDILVIEKKIPTIVLEEE
jgi:hypothetical protein